MKWLLRVLKNRYFLIGFGFFLAVSLILVLGATYQWSWVVRLLGIIAVLIVCLLLVVLSFVRANRSADRIEQAIRQQAEQQLVSTRPDRRAEIEELQKSLNQAIEQLKTSKLGRGKSGRAALYALPWYMFIGPPGAGKTTAIANSGLNFPIGSDRVRGVGGTRNCDWFFSDQAILLDTAGRYMTEQQDEEEWLSFLDTLKAQRTAQPINGVIVGMSMPDLLNASPDEIEWHADNIRRRIDELVARLGVKFPVYLVFTKVDLLQGFVEFYGELSRREREQIWGATVSLEQQASGDLRRVFEEEYDRLHDALVDRRTTRLAQSMKRDERQKVYAFPLQFVQTKERIATFIARLFQPNPYQESPTFRGFYFTSGTQEGIPLDRVIQVMAQQFELSGAMRDDFPMHTEAKSYFIKDLFTDVIVPDQFMVQSTSKASRQNSFQRWGIMAGSLVLMLLFVAATTQAFFRSRADLGAAKEVAPPAAMVQWSDVQAAPQNLTKVEALDQQIDALGGIPILSLGLSRKGTIRAPLEDLYVDRSTAFVQAIPLRQIEQRMRASSSQARVEGVAREELYSDLKAYLLMTSETPRLEEESHEAFLRRYLIDVGTDELEPHLDAPTRGDVQARVEPLVDTYIAALKEGEAIPFGEDPTLVARARQSIIEPPSIAAIYNRLRQEGATNTQPYRLSDAVPGRYLQYFRGDPEVSGFFTKQAWDTYVADAIEEESADPGRDDWVVGRAQSEIPAELRDSERVAAELTDRYFNDYVTQWQRFLGDVRLNGFGGLREAVRAMGDLSDPYESPIVYLLASVTAQTEFGGGLLGDVASEAQAAVERNIQQRARRLLRGGNVDVSQEEDLHPVNRRFLWLHQLDATQAESGNASQDLYQAFGALREVSSALEGMAGDDAKAADYAAGILGQNGGELEAAQRTIRSALRSFNGDIRANLFEAPVGYAWSSVLGSAQSYLNSRWREVVHEPFNSRFASQYPFDASSDLDAPIFDVEAYFNPESGAVAAFIKDELSPFLTRDRSRTSSWNGQGLRLSSSAEAAIERANSIGNSLFSSGAMRVDFELQAEVPERSSGAPAVDQVAIEIHGTENVYNLGSYRPWVPFSWPGNSGAMVSVSTQTGDLPPKRFDGDWALFRMLQNARVTRRSAAAYELRWTFEELGQWNITALYNLRTRSAANPFSDPRSFFAFRPPASLN